MEILSIYSKIIQKKMAVSIELNTEEFLQIEINEAGSCSVGEFSFFTSARIIYDISKQVEILQTDILQVYESVFYTIQSKTIKNINQEIYNQIFKEIMQLISIKFHTYSQFFKDKKYEQEEECRIAFVIANSEEEKMVKHRETNKGPVPYIEFNFNLDKSIRSVRLW